MTIKEAATKLNIHTETLKRYCRDFEIVKFKKGKVTLLNDAQFTKLLFIADQYKQGLKTQDIKDRLSADIPEKGQRHLFDEQPSTEDAENRAVEPHNKQYEGDLIEVLKEQLKRKDSEIERLGRLLENQQVLTKQLGDNLALSSQKYYTIKDEKNLSNLEGKSEEKTGGFWSWFK